MTEKPEEQNPQTPSQGLGRPIFPMRLLGTAACIIISWTYVSNFGEVRLWYLFLLALVLIYPHIIRKLSARAKSRRKIELGATLTDAFLIGSTVYIVGFSSIPTLSLLTIALSNGMALGSFPFMCLTALFLMVGMLTPAFFYGGNYNPQEHMLMDMFTAFFMLSYFILFAWVAYKRSILLKESRQELVQQTLALEIEKKKSDSLLWAILPASMAKIFEASGDLCEPSIYDEVTLLVADVYEFHHRVEAFGPVDVITELNHCFKAFDKIVLRHGMEAFRTMGDAYFAVGGGPVTSDIDLAQKAVDAAVEMQRFAGERKTSQDALDKAGFHFRVAIHTGPAVCGIMESHKFSFDVWGDTMGEILQMEKLGEPGDILVSEATCSRLKKKISAVSIGEMDTRSATPMEIFALKAEAEEIDGS